MKRLFLIALLLNFPFVVAYADEYSPAYLEFKQTNDAVFKVLWKVPAKGQGQRPDLDVVLPDDVIFVSKVRKVFVGNAFIERFSIRRLNGLAGVEIKIRGLETASTDVLVRIQRLDGSSETARLNASTTSFVANGVPKFWNVVNTYLLFGVEHILNGFDHLLFVACLIFIAGSWRRILLTVTGFTLAHSITLTLAGLELVRVPIPPIEATIALSIVFLAREIALNRRDTLTWRYPIIVSSSFGLLHGFGFASALSEIGLPQTEIPAALLAFNIGVEIGQVLFVVSMLAVLWIIPKGLKIMKLNAADSWFGGIEKPVALGVGSVTMFWTIERVAGFWMV